MLDNKTSVPFFYSVFIWIFSFRHRGNDPLDTWKFQIQPWQLNPLPYSYQVKELIQQKCNSLLRTRKKTSINLIILILFLNTTSSWKSSHNHNLLSNISWDGFREKYVFSLTNLLKNLYHTNWDSLEEFSLWLTKINHNKIQTFNVDYLKLLVQFMYLHAY